MEIVWGKWPPNFKEIVAAIPQARQRGVIFAYGNKIYAPPGAKPLTEHLHAHEQVHGFRQLQIGVEYWWQRYCADKDFRFHEELLAHRAEYQSMIKGQTSPAYIRQALRAVAGRLASPLYGCGRNLDTASQAILAGV